MPKETQKQIIERLEKELLEYKALVSKLNKEISNMQDKAEEGFKNSPDYGQMAKRIKELEIKNKSLENTIKHKDNIQKLKNEKKKNERGAGRKKKLTEQELEQMKSYRLAGKTIKEIAEIYGCSVGLVHSVVSGMKQISPLTHEELLEKFKKVNTSVKVVRWLPLINDECEKYADTTKPKIKVILDNGSWLRVYISKEYDDITWY